MALFISEAGHLTEKPRPDWQDVMVVAGLMALSVGLAMYDWRLALVAVGLVLIGLGIAGAMRGG